MPQVIVKISDDGTVTVEGQNVSGPDCAALTKGIENALGKTVSDLKKPEFHQSTSAAQSATAGGRR